MASFIRLICVCVWSIVILYVQFTILHRMNMCAYGYVASNYELNRYMIYVTCFSWKGKILAVPAFWGFCNTLVLHVYIFTVALFHYLKFDTYIKKTASIYAKNRLYLISMIFHLPFIHVYTTYVTITITISDPPNDSQVWIWLRRGWGQGSKKPLG